MWNQARSVHTSAWPKVDDLCSDLNIQLPFENVETHVLYMMHMQSRPDVWSCRNLEKREAPPVSAPETFTWMRRPLREIDFPGRLEPASTERPAGGRAALNASPLASERVLQCELNLACGISVQNLSELPVV
jgi:hypothetical protein